MTELNPTSMLPLIPWLEDAAADRAAITDTGAMRIVHAYREQRQVTRHRLGERPDTEVHVSRMAGVDLKPRKPAPAPRLSQPAPGLLARLIGSATR